MDEFADFFLSKILKKRHELDKHPIYQLPMVNVPGFNQFSKLNEEQVMKLIMNTKSKSCELDPIQTTLLRSNLPSIPTIITNIINPIPTICIIPQELENCNHKTINEKSMAWIYQSANREHRSCETVLLKLTNDLLWSMEKKNVTALIALDLSVAFDTVDHSVLLTDTTK